MPRFALAFRLSLLAFAALLFFACGGGGDTPNPCKNNLIEVDGQCICPDRTVLANCCLSSSDCDVGCTCDTASNTCACTIPDADLDTDTEADLADGDETEAQEDGDEADAIEEGDGTDVSEDGDQSDTDDAATDGDTTDGDQADGDTESDVVLGPCDRVYGSGSLLDFNTLPCPQPQIVVSQSSTRDPNCGADDYRYTDLGKAGNDWVLMDSKHPGCLTRLYFGGTGASTDDTLASSTLKFYFDGNLTLTTTLRQITQGDTAPFLAPLVGRYYQSFYSYVPLCFEKSLRVTLSATQLPIRGFEFTYTTLPDATGIKTYTPGAYSTTALNQVVTAYTSSLGQDPKTGVTGIPSNRSETSIQPGDTRIFYNYATKPGLVTALKLFVSPQSDDILNNTWLEIYWEGKPVPDVNVPIGLFFGSGFGSSEFKSLFVGMSAEGEWYSYFPMPFWKSMNIRLRNKSASVIDSAKLTLTMQDNPFTENAVGLFRAAYNEALPAAKNSPSYKLLDVTGQGRIVGVSMALSNAAGASGSEFLLGDSLLSIDGLATPALHGIGTDAFFNGSRQFTVSADQEPAYTPLFSVAVNNADYKYSARRLFLTDAMPFQAQASLSVEHGDQNQLGATYRSVVYYYLSCLNAIELIDTFNLTDTDDQNTHVLSFPSDAFPYSGEKPSFFEDACGQTANVDSRYLPNLVDTKAYFEFYVLHIPTENQGLRLTRVFDYGSSGSNQGAKIFVVDDLGATEVGTWYDGGHYTAQTGSATMLKESVFEIPPKYTSGKSTLHLRVQYDSGDRWNVQSFKAYAYRQQQSSEPGRVDSATITYTYAENGINPCLHWQKPSTGTVPDSYLIYRSDKSNFTANDQTYVGTSPTTDWCDTSTAIVQSTTYYYRIRASDCTGKTGIASMDTAIPSGVPPICFEAEDTLLANSYAQVVEDPNASGGKYVIYTPDSCAGGAFFFNEPMDASLDGIPYRLTATIGYGPTMGTYVPVVDSSLPSSPDPTSINGFAANFYFADLLLKNTQTRPSSGVLNIKFRCNSAGAGGQSFAVDKFCLSGKGPQRKAAAPEKSFLEEIFPWW